MKSSKWKLGTLAAMAVAALAGVTQAQAALVLTFTPGPAGVTTAGGAVGVDIIVTGATASVGSYAFFLDYTNLSFVSSVAGPGGTLGAIPDDLTVDAAGYVDAFGAAQAPFLGGPADDTTLFGLQGSGAAFTIAHINFTGVADGAFTLGLRNLTLSDFNGNTICTDAGCTGGQIPEPMTPLLVAAALGALALTRKKQQA